VFRYFDVPYHDITLNNKKGGETPPECESMSDVRNRVAEGPQPSVTETPVIPVYVTLTR